MKQYDTIPYYGDHIGMDIIAFYKIDGSNLRFEYSKKRGFYKFGTRRILIDSSTENYGPAVDLFMEKYSNDLDKIFRSKEYRDILSIVCFAEYIGKKSAFGKHDFENDTFDIILFDIEQYKKGFIPPKQFINDFGHLGIPRIIYEGNLNKEFIYSVKRNEFDLQEGVVCKGKKPMGKKENEKIFYCKIKTDDWFNRLKTKDPYLYEQEIKELKHIIL